MRCSKCGFANPAEATFCTKCGTRLEAPAPASTPDIPPPPSITPASTAPDAASLPMPPPSITTPPITSKIFCRQCGAQMEQDAQYCSRCGYKLTAFCPKCGSRLEPAATFCSSCGLQLTRYPASQAIHGQPQVPATPQVSQAPAIPSTIIIKRPFPVGHTIAAGIGSLLMLIALAVPFYTFRIHGYSANVKATDLLTSDIDWIGIGLPVLLIIIFSSVVLLSVIIAFLTKMSLRPLWSSLGILCIWAVIGSAGYMIYWLAEGAGAGVVVGDTGHVVNIVAPGVVMAFIGAIIVSGSGGR